MERATRLLLDIAGGRPGPLVDTVEPPAAWCHEDGHETLRNWRAAPEIAQGYSPRLDPIARRQDYRQNTPNRLQPTLERQLPEQ